MGKAMEFRAGERPVTLISTLLEPERVAGPNLGL
jgi:hypothetical protein